MPSSILHSLRFIRLRFEATVLDAHSVPPYKGDILHKSVFTALAQLWCQNELWRPGKVLDCDICERAGECFFPQLVERRADAGWSRAVRILVGNEPITCYCLGDRGDRRRYLVPGDRLEFDLSLIGAACLHQIEEIARSVAGLIYERGIGPQVEEAGERGRQPERFRARTERIEILGYLPDTGQWGYTDFGEVLSGQGGPGANYALSLEDGQHWADFITEPVRYCSIRYVTPMYLKMHGQAVSEPDFVPLMRALTRRLRLLSEAHGDGEWPHCEYGPLLDLAETVSLDHHEILTPIDSHGKQTFLGQAWYRCQDFRPLLPYLCIGQWLNVTRGGSFGNGHYVIEEVS